MARQSEGATGPSWVRVGARHGHGRPEGTRAGPAEGCGGPHPACSLGVPPGAAAPRRPGRAGRRRLPSRTQGTGRLYSPGFPDAHADPRSAHRGRQGCTAAGPVYSAPPQAGSREWRASARRGRQRGGARRRARRSSQSERSKWPTGAGGGARGRGEAPGGGAGLRSSAGRQSDFAVIFSGADLALPVVLWSQRTGVLFAFAYRSSGIGRERPRVGQMLQEDSQELKVCRDALL